MPLRRWGVLFGVLCAVSLGASDLHLHWDGVGYRDCALCQVADSGRIDSPGPSGFELPALAVSEPPPPPSRQGAHEVLRSLPRSRAPPS